MKNLSEDVVVQKRGPSDSWIHKKLWDGILDALKALPAYFHSDTFIEGINATDIFTLNSALGATIENQVVETLNSIRTVWDVESRYGTYLFVRQPQSFPDVILKNLSDENEPPIMGIELKGWYLLAKEEEPSLRFRQTKEACAEADVIMVVPWVLSSVISGRPKIFSPYIESARYAAEYRNQHWKKIREGKGTSEIEIPQGAKPYPKKSDATNDKPVSDAGGNFGRIARSGLMDEYLSRMAVQPVCGIRASYWLEFFKIFHQDVTEEKIEESFDALRKKAALLSKPGDEGSVLHLISSLEDHIHYMLSER